MQSTPPELGSTKENSGVSAKKRRQKRIFVWAIGVLSLYVAIVTIYNAHFAGMFVQDIEIDPETGRGRVRRRPGRQKKRLEPDKKTYVIRKRR
jgi:hypothetical protein